MRTISRHLVLRRAPGETIVIGKNGDIKITYYRHKNGIAEIGIQAPSNVPVNRSEIHERKINESLKEENSIHTK